MRTFDLLGRPELSMVSVESIGTRVIFWTGANWASKHAAGLEVWELLCSRATRIVEFGANVGYYTIVGAPAAQGTYTAFEPHPSSCAGLRRNLELNGIGGITVHEAAAVPESDLVTVELICPTGNDRDAPSGAMVKGSPFELDDPKRETQTVLVRAEPFTPAIAGSDLVKIDVEGLEAQLLTSGWGQLTADRPAVMVEVHEHNRELRSLLPKLIADLDATAFAMKRDHLIRVEPGVLECGLLATYGTWDFLIVPRDRSAFIDGLVRG
ncbi:MAG: FkbM family methyltransferase [Nocardioides sp.]